LSTRRSQSYVIVGTCFSIQVVYVGILFTFGLMFLEFEQAFGWNRTTISGAFSVFLLTTGFVGVVIGKLNDRFGPSRIMIAGAVIHGIGYALMYMIQAPWQLYLFYGVLAAVGFSTHDVLTLSTVARWFTTQRNLMSGIVKAGAGVGQFITPVLLASVLAVYDWRTACLFISIASTIALVFLAPFLRRDPPPAPNPTLSNEPLVTSGTAASETGMTLRTAAATPNFWIFCAGQFLVFFCLMAIMVHIVPHARDLGFAPGRAAQVLAAIGGASIVGRIVMGGLGDRMGGKRALTISYLLLTGNLIWILFIENPWILFLFAPIYGFTHGAFFTLISPTVAEFFGTRSHGVIFAIVLLHGTIGGAMSPIIAGLVFDATGTYQPVFITLSVLAFTGLILINFVQKIPVSPAESNLLPCSQEH